MFLLVVPDEDDLVTCPRCQARFEPDDVELLDPEDA
ncbi:MAG: hypothetical protein K6W08_02740 [Firmicutes bacterium]|nr:hypothetical protein [Bacillota bacterium]